MYFKYVWLAGASATNVLADLVATICSNAPTTDALSTSCNKVNSLLISNETITNWTVYDASASATSQVLRSLNNDGITYKYIQIIVTASLISIQGWESWNASTHVGTNGATSNLVAPAVISFAFSLTVAGNISLIATPKLCAFINNPLTNTANIFLSEFSRESVLLNDTYPCIVTGTQLSKFLRNTFSEIPLLNICRVKNPSSAGDQLAASIGNPVMMNNLLGASGANLAQGTGALGIDGVNHLVTTSIQLGYTIPTGLQTKLGTVYDLLIIPANTLVYSNLDEIVIDAVTYVMVASGNTAILLIPKA